MTSSNLKTSTLEVLAPASIKWQAISSAFLLKADSRLDASSYSIETFQALSKIENCRLIKASIGSLCGTIWHPVQTQARSNFKRVYTKAEFGDPYVGSREMFFFPLRPEKHLSRAYPKLQELRVPKGWLLLSRSGTVGNVLYCSEKISKCLITDHAIRIEPTRVPAGYLYAFLASRFGQPLLLNSTYGSTVSEIEPKHIAVLPIPMADGNTQNEIHELIVEAYRLRDHANDLLDEADRQLHEALGIAPFDEIDVEYLGATGDPKAFAINATELGVRLDASHHVPLSRSAVHKLKKCRVPVTFLSNAGVSIFIPARFKRNYVEASQGVPYLIPSQVILIRPYGLKYLSPGQAKASPEYLLQKGELLVSTDGTIGRLHIVTDAMQGWFGSNNLARLRSNHMDIGFLYAYLATPFGQHQICREIYGGVIDHISEKQLANVFVPIVDKEEQQTIGKKVFEAFAEKDKANSMETRAIAHMEAIIEGKA